jgi:DNA processing protein
VSSGRSTSSDAVAAHLLALATLPEVGPATLGAILAGPGPEEAWGHVLGGRADRVPPLARAIGRSKEATPSRLAALAAAIDPLELLHRHRALGCRALLAGQPGYPPRLAADPAPPALVLARGDLAALDRPSVAIVGTRNATLPGVELARELGAGLAARGIAVVSGLALGIDGAAHRGALEVVAAGEGAAGPPVGVVATGPDRCYPSRHAGLHRAVADHGLLITETPIGCRPVAWRFPARNRLIAALADAVVVVESRITGGSMSTVAEALARGRTVGAVPGHPSVPSAAGTNALIVDGAVAVRDVEDVLVAIGRGGSPAVVDHSAPPRSVPAEDGPARTLDRLLQGAPQTLGQLVDASGLGLDEVSLALEDLVAGGSVVCHAGWFERATGRSAR